MCFYVGQTKQSISKRIRQHISCIKCFIPFLRFTSEVGFHFNLKGHEISKHFRFCVFKSNINDDILRYSVETDIINLIKLFHPPILNLNTPSIYSIKQPTFHTLQH